jgi:putative endonuclease
MSERRRRAEQRGRRGETLAGIYLWLTGWRIVGRRVKTRKGEVDLIARRGRTLCFVEVKWRASEAELATAIDAWRLRRVADAAQLIAARYARPGDDQRIDVILIAPGCWPRRITNAWQPGAM